MLHGLSTPRHAGLTRLTLASGSVKLAADGGAPGPGALLEALRGLTGLRALGLANCLLDVYEAQHLWGSLRAMRGLNDLALNSVGVRAEISMHMCKWMYTRTACTACLFYAQHTK